MNQLAVTQFVCAVLALRANKDSDRRWLWETRQKVARFRLSVLQRTSAEPVAIDALSRDERQWILDNDPLLRTNAPGIAAQPVNAEWREQLQARVQTVMTRMKSRRTGTLRSSD
ncbi:MAG: hypothetical protein HZA46_03590 [Planctomycetales bacterium]|nr:hypothetical protein [Planctomycetales bacterium]